MDTRAGLSDAEKSAVPGRMSAAASPVSRLSQGADRSRACHSVWFWPAILFLVVIGAGLIGTVVWMFAFNGGKESASSVAGAQSAPATAQKQNEEVPLQAGVAGLQAASETETSDKDPGPENSIPLAQLEAMKRQLQAIAQDLLAAYPNEPNALMLSGIGYARFGDSAKALQYWQHGLDLDSGRADLSNAMATVLLQTGEHAKAAEVCRAILSKSAGTPVLYCLWSEALHGLGQAEEARQTLQRAVALFPRDAQSHRLLGKSYLLLGDCEKARASYETAVKLDPRDVQAHYGLSVACARLGMEDQSRQALEEYRKLQSHVVSAERTDTMDALHDLRGLQSTLEMVCLNAAAIYGRHNRPDKAEELLRQGVGADPKGVKCRVQLALACLHSNREAEAIALCKQLIAIEPKNVSHHLALATIYVQLGQIDDARAVAKQALDIAPDNEQCRNLWLQLQGRK